MNEILLCGLNRREFEVLCGVSELLYGGDGEESGRDERETVRRRRRPGVGVAAQQLHHARQEVRR